ncbi:hypothetical protein ACXYRO_01965 [Mycoplasma sp. 4013]
MKSIKILDICGSFCENPISFQQNDEIEYIAIFANKQEFSKSSCESKILINENLKDNTDDFSSHIDALMLKNILADAEIVLISSYIDNVGTWLTPTITKLAKMLNKLVVSVIKIPLQNSYLPNIKQYLDKIIECSDAYTFVSTQKIHHMYPDFPDQEINKIANLQLSYLINFLNENANNSINLANLKKTLENSGLTYITAAKASGSNLSSKIIKKFSTYNLNDSQIQNAAKVFVNIKTDVNTNKEISRIISEIVKYFNLSNDVQIIKNIVYQQKSFSFIDVNVFISGINQNLVNRNNSLDNNIKNLHINDVESTDAKYSQGLKQINSENTKIISNQKNYNSMYDSWFSKS